MTPLDTEVLPCPMCGGKAHTNTRTFSEKSDEAKLNGQRTFHGVNCIVCGLNNIGLIGWGNPDEAIANWNRRATPQPDVAAIRNQALEEAAVFADSYLMTKTSLPVENIVALTCGIRALSTTPAEPVPR